MPGVIAYLTGSTALVTLLLVAIRVWVSCRPTCTPEAEDDELEIENTLAYRRLLDVASWSGGSLREWEHRVQPVLSHLLGFGPPYLIEDDRAVLLGRHLSSVLNESREPASGDSVVEQGALVAILDRLELILETGGDDESGPSPAVVLRCPLPATPNGPY